MQRAGSGRAGCMYPATSEPPKSPLGVAIWAGGSLALDKRSWGHHIFQKSRKKGRCTMLERLWGYRQLVRDRQGLKIPIGSPWAATGSPRAATGD